MQSRSTTVGNLAAASANFYVTSVTPTSGQVLTLANTTVATPRRVLLTFGNEAGNRTLALVGTNSTGAVIKETLNVASGAAGSVYTVQDFLTVTSATSGGGAWTTNMTLGTNGVASSDWRQIATNITPTEVAIACAVTGTATYTIEYTYTDLNALALSGNQGFQAFTVPVVFGLSTLSNKTASADGFINDPAWAWRLVINSGGLASTGSSVTATAVQAGIRQ